MVGYVTPPTRRTLSERELNRAVLARQGLLDPLDEPLPRVLERVAGIQAQYAPSMYVGLWSRLEGFDPENLSRLIRERDAVRTHVMRTTIHLVSARDCALLRPLLQPAITGSFKGSAFSRELEGLDLDAVVASGRALLEEQPRTRAELSRLLAERWPDHDPPSLEIGRASCRERV